MNAASRRRFLQAAAAAAFLPIPAAGARAKPLGGVNLSGLEFNPHALPGRVDTDYVAPTPAELDYYRAAGARLVRVPFLWERLQPVLGGPFDPGYSALIARLVRAAAVRNMRIVLDAHQYGRRQVDGQAAIVGESDAVPARSFAAFWGALAGRYKNSPHVIFNLTNEPHDQDVGALVRVQNAAIAAIRAAGARQLILASGTGWSGAHSWMAGGNAEAMARLRDPGHALAFDVHQYLDADSSGTHGECARGAGGARLAAFTAWARAHKARGFLGEFGAGAGESCLAELDALLAYMDANADVWLGWAAWGGGPWWPPTYPLALDPGKDKPDRPQLRVLAKHWRS